MDDNVAKIDVAWDGPYSWPSFEAVSKLPTLPKISGVYLFTFQYMDGFLIYAAGITRRLVHQRLKEHTKKYMNGEYNVLDIAEARKGIRKEIWHGWSYARDHRAEFEERQDIILNAVKKQLAEFCIFVASVSDGLRVRERIEASIMNSLYQQSSPFCDIPDKGMHLEPRLDIEFPIVIKNTCPVKLYGLPNDLEI